MPIKEIMTSQELDQHSEILVSCTP